MKPLLAAVAELDKIEFPVYTSPKLDGIRCLIDPIRGPVSRTGKPIPNKHIRETLEDARLAGFDGELITYCRGRMQRFEDISSAVMSAAGEPEFVFHVFDDFSHPERPYEERLMDLAADPKFALYDFLCFVEGDEAYSMADLKRIHRGYVRQGWEGTMIRKPEGPYKHGRSTVREGYLSKLKDFQDDEATITGFVERQNHPDSLGAFVVSWRGVEFNIGTGLTEQQRQSYWNFRESMIGRTLTFSFQNIGTNGRPRFPAFVGFRRDLVAA